MVKCEEDFNGTFLLVFEDVWWELEIYCK